MRMEERWFCLARYLFVHNHKTQQDTQWPKKAQVVWVDLGKGDRGKVADTVKHLYPAHPVAINKVLSHEIRSRPSLLVEDDALVFVMSQGAQILPGWPRQEIGVFWGQNFLVTVHLEGDNPAVDGAWEYLLQNNLLAQGVDFALYQMLTRHVDYYRRLQNQVDDEFERVNRIMLKYPAYNLAPDILHLRKTTLSLQNIVQPELDIFALFKSPDIPYVQKSNRPYFQDLASEMKDLVSRVASTRDALSGLVEAYTSMQSNDINKVMKFLAILSVLALPATTIASIYGMNFYIPEIHWHYGYWYSLVLMAVVTGVTLVYMREQGWFGDKSPRNGENGGNVSARHVLPKPSKNR